MRLLPGLLALWRGEDECQIGADPRLATVLTGLRGNEHRLIDALRREVPRSRSPKRDDLEQLARTLGIEPDRARAITAHLRARGMLTERVSAEPHDPDPVRAQRRAATEEFSGLAGLGASGRAQATDAATGQRMAAGSVVIVGGNRLGLKIGQLLVEAGVGAVSILDEAPVGLVDVSPGGYRPQDVGQPRQRACLARIRAVDSAVRSAPVRPDLVILVEQRVAVPYRSSGLQREDQAHLSVVVRELDIVVGPLVIPGRTGCLRCLDLRRCEADPAWPVLATQLAAAEPPRVPPVLLTLAAATAATAAIGHLTGGRPELHDVTAEIGPRALWQRRRWRPHPECGCGVAAVGAP